MAATVRKISERGQEIASELTRLKAELGSLGLFKTMHALDHATRAIGYELAEYMEAVRKSAQKDAQR